MTDREMLLIAYGALCTASGGVDNDGLESVRILICAHLSETSSDFPPDLDEGEEDLTAEDL